MKITVGQLKKMIHSQLAEAKKPPRSNVADYNQHRIAVDTVKNPNKSMFGGPSAEESEEILRNKFGYTDQEINMLKGVTESRSSGDVKKINEVRKSSDAVVSAFLNQQNKRVSNKKSENGVLSLHNNPVAKYGENGGIWISDGGYGISATTAELLNNIPGVRVNIKNRAWMLDGKPWDGKWTKIDFTKFGADFKSRSGTNESRSSGDVKKINEGKKRYYTQDNIGRAKYTVSFHDGISKHDDGGDFFNIKIFHNKRERDAFIKQLNANGYHERGFMEDGFKPKGEVKKINEATFTKLIKKLIVEETEALKSGKLNESITRYYLETWVDGKQRVGSDNTLAFGDNPVGSTALKNRVAMRINIMKKSFNIYPELKTAKSIVLKYVKNSYTGGGDSVIREFDVTKQVQSSI